MSSWWSGLPGTDMRFPVANQRLTNRIVAAACAAHIMGVDPHTRGWTGQLPSIAESFLRWLAGSADDEDGYARRIALCIASANAGPDVRRQVLDTAKTVYQWLSAGAEPADSDLRERWTRRA